MIIKCKMCGGDLHPEENGTTCTCEFCGSVQTIPKLDNERRMNLYDRGNHFRRQNEYDKAMGIFEQILQEDRTDAEAYWSLVLCRWGIEYVEDPATKKRLPTVNRVQLTSVLADEDYLSALQYADGFQKTIYEQEARAIDEIQKGILAISRNEQPFDVFICYKETDESGRRTPDSVLANELYHQLTNEGFKVFFSRITLEDKIGTAYEPYIFAALQSARVMVVLGTKPEYFKAVWVRNEWSRFLAMIRAGEKKTLVPAYRDMDPYDLPDEFSHLQAQDMGRLGFMQDLIRGIRKILGEEKPAAPVQQVVVQQTAAEGTGNVAALLERAFMALEDGEFAQAIRFCEQVLNQDARNAQAYLGKLMAGLQVRQPEQLGQQKIVFEQDSNYQKIMRFGNESLKAQVQGWLQQAKVLKEQHETSKKLNEWIKKIQQAEKPEEIKAIRLELAIYENSKAAQEALRFCDKKEAWFLSHQYQTATQLIGAKKWSKARSVFSEIIGYRDAEEQIRLSYLNQAKQIMESAETEEDFRHAAFLLENIPGYQNADEIREECIRRAEEKTVLLQQNMERLAVLRNRTKELNGILAVSPNQQKPMHVAVDMEGNVYPSSVTNEKLNGIRNWKHIVSVSVGEFHVLGLRMNGTAVAVGSKMYGQINVESWQNLTDVVAGGWHSLGLKTDGTVVAAGSNENGQCNVGSWRNVVKIAAGNNHSVALKKDGTVVATGFNERNACNVGSWTDVTDIAAFNSFTVGLKKDGTVLCTHKDYDVSDWKDVVDIAVGCSTVLGLCKDGTVRMSDANKKFEKQYPTAAWRDIVAISAHNAHMVGLKADGTVVATGYNHQKQCDVQDLRNIVYVSAGEFTTVAIRKDGKVISVGRDIHQPYTEVYKWPPLFENPDTYQQDRRKQIEERRERMKKGLCPYCGGEIKKGLFSEKCKNCGKAKDY